MCVCMEKRIDNVLRPLLGFVDDVPMNENTDYQQAQLSKSRSTCTHGFRRIQERGIMGVAIPKLSQVYILRYENATLMNSSTTTFGNECMRLVNIVFRTSQMFPSMMGTYGIISQYLRKELLQKHPNKQFHIIIGQNDDFSFAISDDDYFAQIKQEQYRVLIFSTKAYEEVKVDTYVIDNHMQLQWKSIVIKRMNN